MARPRRRLREEIDLLWRTSALRTQAMQPLDEVRSGTAIFDETLFGLAPSVYRALDLALLGDRSGSQLPEAPAFLRFGSWIGADRDGNPFVTATVTQQTARIQADHALRALENAATRIGRSLTVDAVLLAASAADRGGRDAAAATGELDAALAVLTEAQPGLLAELMSRSPGEPFRTYLLHAAQRLQATRLSLTAADGASQDAAARDSAAAIAYGSAAEFIAELRLLQRALAEAGAPPAGLRRAAAPDLAGGDIRVPPRRARGTPAQRGACRRAGESCGQERRAVRADQGGARQRCRDRRRSSSGMAWMRVTATWSASPPPPMTSPRCTSWPGYACPDGPPVLDVVPLFESGDDLAHAVSVLDGDGRA